MDDKLRSLVGVLSFREIAGALGVSRSAAIGRASRIGLSKPRPKLTQEQKFIRDAMRELKRLAHNRRRTERRHRQIGRGEYIPFNPRLPRRTISDIPCPVSLDLPLLDLGKRQCRYPVTDDTPFLFCGAPQQDESSYCPYHDQVCSYPTARQARAAA